MVAVNVKTVTPRIAVVVPIEDLYLDIAQSLFLSDKNVLAQLAVTGYTYPILPHFLNTSKSLAIRNGLYVVVHYAFMFT